MLHTISRRPWLMLGTGLALGLLIGAGMLLGALVGANYAGRSTLSELPLHALATHGSDTMAIATTPIEEGNEGLVTLDYLTGELRVFVMNHRAGKFTLVGKTNVLTDLKVERGKKPNFLLVCGTTNFVRGGAALNPAISTVYVCDTNSGNIVAYGMAYSRTAFAAATAGEIAFTRLDAGVARTINLGEQ